MKEGLPDERSFKQGFSSGAWTGARSPSTPRLLRCSSVLPPARMLLGVLGFSSGACCVLILPRSCLRASRAHHPSPCSLLSQLSSPSLSSWPVRALLLKTQGENWGPLVHLSRSRQARPGPWQSHLGWRPLSGSDSSGQGPAQATVVACSSGALWAQQCLGKGSRGPVGPALWLKRRSPCVPAETCARTRCSSFCSRQTLETAVWTV